MEIDFPYFLKKEVRTSTIGINEYKCKMHGSLHDKDDLVLAVKVPISPPIPGRTDNGLPRSLGHWGIADINLRFRHFIWIEDLIQMVEEVTSHNLSWPKAMAPGAGSYLSVEKITKTLGKKLADHPDISWFSLRVENLSEGFSTFASLEWPETPEQMRSAAH